MDNIALITWPRGRRGLMADLLRLCLGKAWGEAWAKGQALLALGTQAAAAQSGTGPDAIPLKPGEMQLPGLNYLVEYEDFPLVAVLGFENYVAKGGEDSAESFRLFASHSFARHAAFAALWVTSEFARDQLVVEAAELRANSQAWLLWALGALVPGFEITPAMLAKAERMVAKWGIENPTPDITAFRHYDPLLFELLANLKLRRDEVQRVFREVLERDPDEQSMLQRQSLVSAAVLRANLMASKEYQSLQADRAEDSSPSVPQLAHSPSAAKLERAHMGTPNAPHLRESLPASPVFTAHCHKAPERDPSQPRTLIHIHIPKTAGTSLNSVLEKSLGGGMIMEMHVSTLGTLADLTPVDRRGLRLLRGHMLHGVGSLLTQPALYLTVLRQPGPRIFSFYQFVKRSETHPFHAVTVDSAMTFGDFLLFSRTNNDLEFELNNGQMRRIAGSCALQDSTTYHDLFRNALRNIFAPDMMFGLTEHFKLFLVQLAAARIIRPSANVMLNTSATRHDFADALSELSPQQREIYDIYIRWDEKFYNIAESYILGLNRERDFTA